MTSPVGFSILAHFHYLSRPSQKRMDDEIFNIEVFACQNLFI